MTDLPLLDVFRAAVMADPAAQQMLAELRDPEAFIAKGIEWANARGIALTPADLAGARPDPLAIHGFAPPPQSGAAWPPRQWLPARCAIEAGFAIDWYHYAAAPLAEPFFADTRNRAGMRPFNQLFRYRTQFGDFIQADREGALQPDGFIFHMSRCGSTLVSQMLAALPGTIVVSEADMLDMIVQLPLLAQGVSNELHIDALRAVVAALGRDRSGTSQRYFIKLDSWHTLALPLFRQAFPDVPWIFLYREPVEVLVSQERMRGTQTAPGVLPPQIFGFTEAEMSLPDVDYIARVLARTCSAVTDQWELGGGLAVDYRELPDAMLTRILPHFGIDPAPGERALLDAASGRDAKAPDTGFKPDSARKREEAGPATRAAAERHMAAVHARLQALNVSWHRSAS
ncbi:sulfotransferase [Sphingomonas sp. LB-2]|uniref:sulfotransferase family protein n=1 Tax=Sphingomonas caeni TaxID=2984949 RepID=UPI002230D1CC|nr:sulfotransferase [Sphingomonas caeni]MCW3847201.1 sulfotransferase [Sphingomonas caeni]